MARIGPVLIVENVDAEQRSMDSLFRKTGYTTEVVKNVQDALEWLRSHGESPCAILLEAQMTAAAVKDFFEELQGEFPHLYSSLPVIVSKRRE